ncbi:MAG TPA: polysaccharide deacetylase family protein [Gaiellaceae bacterium]|nr:polysaccharide deacetylase family protein [Gaiellaceae bacterium]
MTRNGYSDSVLVLEYHAVSEAWPAALAVTPAQLREQLEWLVARGYTGATFSDAVTSSRPGRTLVVTFDDAYLSVFELARPILASLGLPGTVFVVTDFADSGRPLHWPRSKDWRGGPHEHELRGMTWPQLAELADSGWEIGSHTRTHPRLTSLGDDELARELRESREACERALGLPCSSLAYPYGDFDARVATRAGEAGYKAAATEILSRPEPLAWPRVGIYRADSLSRFRVKVSPTVRRLRTIAGGAPVLAGRAKDR